MNSEKGAYHELLKKVLEEFHKENKVKLEKNRGSIKLTSKKKRCKNILEYDPDYCLKFKTGKRSFEYIVFEFLDTQSDEGIFADIIECACIENCRLLIFLSKDLEKHNKAIDIRNVVSDSIKDLSGKDALEIINLHIPIDMDKEQIMDEIYKEIDKKVKLPYQPFILGKSLLGGRGRLS